MEFDYIYRSQYSGDVEIALEFSKYTNGGTAIEMFCNIDGFVEPWSNLTVWLPGLDEDEVAIDVNHLRDGLEWAIENNLVEPPHRYKSSGYVTYPICKLKTKDE